MNIGIVALSLVVLTSVLHVDARSSFMFEQDGKLTTDIVISHQGSAVVDSFISSSVKLSPEFICQSCLEVSREVEKLLDDPSLPEKVNVFANDACHILPADLEVKCVEMLNSYTNQAILFLQTYFSEKSLCNSTGLCPADSVSISASSRNDQLPLTRWISDVVSESGESSLIKLPQLETSIEVSDGKNCDACHAIMDELRNDLEDPEIKIKIIRVLLNACKNTGNHVNQCKRMVLEYGPMILSKFEGYLVNNDLCNLVHICEAPTSFTFEPMADF